MHLNLGTILLASANQQPGATVLRAGDLELPHHEHVQQRQSQKRGEDECDHAEAGRVLKPWCFPYLLELGLLVGEFPQLFKNHNHLFTCGQDGLFDGPAGAQNPGTKSLYLLLEHRQHRHPDGE